MDKQQLRRRERQHMQIVAAIKRAREKAGISKRGLSIQLGQVPAWMQKVETLQRGLSASELIDIGRALDVDPCDLLRAGIPEHK